MKMNKILVIDATSLLYPTFFASKGNVDEITKAGLALHGAFTTFFKYYKKFKPNKVVAAFDRSSWRKKLTREDDDFDFIYKGNRRKNMSPADRVKFEAFVSHIQKFEEILTDHTGIVTLAGDGMEGDDFVARVAQRYGKDNEVICVTGDSDLAQLQSDNVTVFNAKTGKSFDLKKYDNDPEYYLFFKCIRGDNSDDIPSAFPRVRTTRIKKAYEDPYEFTQFMKETVQIGSKTNKVAERYAQNKLLIDLTQQPEYIIAEMDRIIDEAMMNPGQYSHFHFQKFCSEFELENLRKNLISYAEMLT